MTCYKLFIVLLFIAGQLNAQQLAPNQFAHYTTASGLSDNNVTGITQDATGYIWLSTSLGLNRYNGSAFTQFHTTNDNRSLPSEDLMGLAWLDKHRMAVYASGLHIINTKTGTTQNLFIPYHDKKYQYKFNIMMTAKGDANGDLFLLNRSGFYHYDKDYRLLFRFDYYKDKDVPTSHFLFGNIYDGDLFDLDAKRLLIIGADGLYLYHKATQEFRKMKASDCPLLAEFLGYPAVFSRFFQPAPGSFMMLKLGSDSLVYVDLTRQIKTVSKLPFPRLGDEFHYRSKLMRVDDTTFYLTSHNAGFYKMQFDKNSGAVTVYSKKYFAAYLCNDLLIDRDNNLWVATSKGVFRQDDDRLLVQTAQIPAHISDSIPALSVATVHATAGTVYAGTKGFAGLLLFDKKTFQFAGTLRFPQQVSAALVNAIVPLDESNLLLGTGPPYRLDIRNNTLTKMQPEHWMAEDWISELYKDRKGGIWVSCEQLYRYHPVTRAFALLPQQMLDRALRINSFCEDRQGNVWFSGHGLSRYNVKTGRVDKQLDSIPFIKMPDLYIVALVADGQNNLWFGSNNNGLTRYNVDNGSFRLFSRNDGLPEGNVRALKVIDNKLWIACHAGIACMDLRTSKIMRFGKEDGFPDMPGYEFFYDTASRQLYLSFSKAIVRFSPQGLLQKTAPPHLFIEEIVLNGRKRQMLPEGAITTSWQDNDIRINIGSINFSNGSTQRFAYRILEKETAPWEPLGSQTTFSIFNLSPGSYRIQVKVFSLYNRWPEQVKELTVVVLPPLWLEDWFLVLTGITALVLLYMFIKWRTGLARKKEQEKTYVETLKAAYYKNQFELEQITNYFSSSLAGKKTEDEVLWDVAQNLIGRMKYEDCIIYIWNKDKTKMVQKAGYGPKGAPEKISSDVFEVEPGQGIVGHVIQTRQPLLVNDTRMDGRYRVDDAFRLSELAVPIIHNNELLGVIDSEHSQANYFSERDIQILTTIATLIGNKLKQIQSERSLEAKQQELAGINEQLAEARLSALQAQMNPHFVFNALNSIKRMILDSDNEKASRYLSKFALMIRMTLEHSKEVFVTLDENIEYLKAYLDMEQLRFDDSFTYTIHTDANVDTMETALPSMMIQPLVENAIWHGLLQAEGNKKIQITFSQRENKIICTVEDNGMGIHRSEKLREKSRPLHHSVGLQNLQKRIRIINEKYNTDCSLEITDLSDTGKNRSGTRVVLMLNIINV